MAERIEGRSVTNPLFYEPVPDVALRAGYDVNPQRNVNVQSSILPSWRQITQPPLQVSSPEDHPTETIVQKQPHEAVSVQNWGTPGSSVERKNVGNEDGIALADIREEIDEISEQLLADVDALSALQDERRTKTSACITEEVRSSTVLLQDQILHPAMVAEHLVQNSSQQEELSSSGKNSGSGALKAESPLVGYIPTIYKEGNLLRRQRGVSTSSSRLKSLKFKQQYCRLTSVALEYYERKKDRKPRGRFPMDQVKIVEKVPSQTFAQNCCFQIGDDKEQMYLACQTFQERQQWIQAFRQAALDSGNKMLSHYHWGVYGLTEKDRWSCCKCTGRVCQGCYPVGTDENTNGDNSEAQQDVEHQDSVQNRFSVKDVVSELQDASSWLHLSVHVDHTPGNAAVGAVDGDSKKESLLDSLQQKTPACSKILKPLVQSGLVTVADSKDGEGAVLSTTNEVSLQPDNATDLVTEPIDQESDEKQEDSPPPLADLVNELQEVTDWFYLGMCLRVPLATLMAIRESHGNVEAYRREMLDAWMKEEKPTWLKVVTALKEMKLTALAKRLASKFDVDAGNEVKDAASQEQHASGSDVVQLDWRYVDKNDQELPKNLIGALKKVKAWYPLGLYLGIPKEELQKLKSKRVSAQQRARKILMAWMEKEVASWTTLVQALSEVGATDLAYKIASKYCVPLADQPGEGDPSVGTLNKFRTKLGVKINAELLSVSFHKDCSPGWDFTMIQGDEDTSVDASATQREERVDLKDVISELREVTDWFYLGMCLGIPTYILQSIKQDYRDTDGRKREVFLSWMKMEEPTWSKIVRVLQEMGKTALANQIAQDHGLQASDSNEPMELIAGQVQGEEGELSLPRDAEEDKPKLKDLLRELQEVTEWQPLGQLLGLKTSDLEAIFEDNQTTEDCRREMLMLWMERDLQCSWQKVTDALVQMKALSLATQIARKYGVPLPQEVSDEVQGAAEEVQEDLPCPEGLHTQMEGVAMKDLLTEVYEVTDWFHLGVCLGVSESKLKAIRQDYEDIEDRKREMLISWMEKEIATWPKIINALAEIGMHKLAIAIASKYGETVPPSLHEALAKMEKDVAEGQDYNDGAGANDSSLEPTLEDEGMIVPDYEDQGEVKLKDLVNELRDVTDWFTFGVYLEVEVTALLEIKGNQMDTNSCRRDMLSVWMKRQEPTWQKVVGALVELKLYRLAVKIASKYKVAVSKKMVKAMRGVIPEGELRVLKVEEVEESDDSESSSDEDEEEADMKKVIQELKEVTEWHHLGLCLGVDETTLKAIRKDIKATEYRKRQMLFAWSKLKVPTWRRVVRALLEMEEKVLAERIAKKYNVPLPKSVNRRPRPEEVEEEEEDEPEHLLPKEYGFYMMDAFWSGNVIQLIAKSNGYPIQVKEARIRGLGSFRKPTSQFTVLTPRGAPRGEIVLQNVFWPGTYLAILGRVYLATAEGLACRLRVHIDSDNLVSFEAVNSPGQYLGMSNSGTACLPKNVKPDQVEAKFYIRVQRQMYQYLTTIMTEFGRPSVANLLQDECTVQLYVKQINAFLAITRLGQVTSTANYSDFETHFRIKDNGNGVYSLSSTRYRGFCIRIKDNIQHGRGELSLDANFYLRENFNSTVSFQSVTCPTEFISISDGVYIWRDFSLFSVKVEHPQVTGGFISVTRTPLTYPGV